IQASYHVLHFATSGTCPQFVTGGWTPKHYVRLEILRRIMKSKLLRQLLRSACIATVTCMYLAAVASAQVPASPVAPNPAPPFPANPAPPVTPNPAPPITPNPAPPIIQTQRCRSSRPRPLPPLRRCHFNWLFRALRLARESF